MKRAGTAAAVVHVLDAAGGVPGSGRPLRSPQRRLERAETSARVEHARSTTRADAPADRVARVRRWGTTPRRLSSGGRSPDAEHV